MSEHYSLTAGCKADFLNKRLRASLLFSDILRTHKFKLKGFVAGIFRVEDYYCDCQALRFSLRYRFGNKKIRSRLKDFDNEAERNRIEAK